MFLIELGAVSILDSANVAGEFDCRDLHAETKAEIGQLIFPGETRRFDFAFHPAFAKPARDENAGDIFELAIDSILERSASINFRSIPQSWLAAA